MTPPTEGEMFAALIGAQVAVLIILVTGGLSTDRASRAAAWIGISGLPLVFVIHYFFHP